VFLLACAYNIKKFLIARRIQANMARPHQNVSYLPTGPVTRARRDSELARINSGEARRQPD
jgi:hypothetical protein